MADLTVSAAVDSLMASANQADMRTALGLGTAATSASTAFATAAQGAKADSAVQPAAIAKMVQSDTSAVSGSVVISNVIALTTAQYTGIGTKNANTLYAITDA